MVNRPAGRVLVLGGTGFVGRAVCTALLAAGRPVTVVARRHTDAAGMRQLRADLATRSAAELRDLIEPEQPTAVVNAAGAVWDVDRPEMRAVNVDLVRRLVVALSGLPAAPRFVQLGTVHEYGPVPRGVALTEQSPLRPAGTYGQTKLLGSTAVLAAAESGALDATVLRLSNVIGPGNPPSSLLGMVSAALTAAARDGRRAELELLPLTRHRDFVDVRDVASAVLSATTAPARGTVLNIGSGTATGSDELVRRLIAVSGVPARLTRNPAPGERSARRGADWQRLDIAAARRALSWQPRYALERTLTDIWRAAAGALEADSSCPAVPDATVQP